MNTLEQRFFLEKQAVGRVLGAFLAADPASIGELAAKLENELGEQIRFDHRQEDSTSLRKCWDGLPPISEHVKSSEVSIPQIGEIQGLADSTYAYRLLALAHVLGALAGKPDSLGPFEAFLSTLGLGLAEVEAYRKDFVG